MAAAWACERLGTPLPWMIGPLLATAAGCMAGVPLRTAAPLRNAGQWAIGTALGLYFTPQVLALLTPLAPALLAGVAWALLIGALFAAMLRRAMPGVDAATAHFAAAIGGASEMAALAERHGGRIDMVAAAHSLRVLLVVLVIPFGYQAAGLHGLDTTPLALHEVRPGGLALLALATAAGSLVVRRLGLPNPWVLGSLAVAAALSGAGVELSALPRWISNGGQLFIGIALGTRFSRSFLRTAPRWLGAVALGTLAMIAASAGFAWLLAQLVRIEGTALHWATVLLGTSPGGIAEMCITAKVLQLGVPVVTAFHVVRYIAVLLLTGPLYRRRAARGVLA
ncbi:AbrB family transcriptional regulator [Aquincola sp. MAHUQ-54]|uniref:AbrB family transcriptional regulator n=2 Tax=Sphaerotilaceae TaxID=2975441 RepID=A0AAW9QQH1_9BURK